MLPNSASRGRKSFCWFSLLLEFQFLFSSPRRPSSHCVFHVWSRVLLCIHLYSSKEVSPQNESCWGNCPKEGQKAFPTATFFGNPDCGLFFFFLLFLLLLLVVGCWLLVVFVAVVGISLLFLSSDLKSDITCRMTLQKFMKNITQLLFRVTIALSLNVSVADVLDMIEFSPISEVAPLNSSFLKSQPLPICLINPADFLLVLLYVIFVVESFLMLPFRFTKGSVQSKWRLFYFLFQQSYVGHYLTLPTFPCRLRFL